MEQLETSTPLPPVSLDAVEFAASVAAEVRQLSATTPTLENVHRALDITRAAMDTLLEALDAAESAFAVDVLHDVLTEMVRGYLSTRRVLERLIEIQCARRSPDDTVH